MHKHAHVNARTRTYIQTRTNRHAHPYVNGRTLKRARTHANTNALFLSQNYTQKKTRIHTLTVATHKNWITYSTSANKIYIPFNYMN